MKRYSIFLKENANSICNFSVIGDTLTQIRKLGSTGEVVSFAIDYKGECVAIVPLDAAIEIEEIKP